MSKIVSNYNKNNYKFNIDFEQVEFIRLSELFENTTKVYIVNGIYKNTKGFYGDSYCILTGNRLVNMPKHLNTTLQQILEDDEAIAEIKTNKIGFVIVPYTKDNKMYYSIEFINNTDYDLPF